MFDALLAIETDADTIPRRKIPESVFSARTETGSPEASFLKTAAKAVEEIARPSLNASWRKRWLSPLTVVARSFPWRMMPAERRRSLTPKPRH